MKSSLLGAVACATLSIAAGTAQAAVTPFEVDVATAIDRGLTYLANQGSFTNPSSAGDAAGLPMLALLEKRASGIPTDPPQGYSGANAVDQGRLRNAAAYILDRVNETSFYAYRDGGYMFALSEYALTGGPDKSVLAPGNADYQTIKQAMDSLVDRSLATQRSAATGFLNVAEQGYWCYTNQFCEDSSTTQFVVAGLAAAKAFYASNKSGDGGAFADPARVALIDAALARSRAAYELNAAQGSDNGACSVVTPTERGHGYNSQKSSGYAPSLQQTASGIYIQLFGGSNINTPAVQQYTEWLRNHYRWQNLDNMGNFWPDLSWGYYLWSSFKGMELIRQSGIAPAAGNVGPNDLGKLAAATAPTCGVRQENKNPATLTRVASFGAGGVGYYSLEPKGQYFDYAHQILSNQCGDGGFFCNEYPGAWDIYSHQAYNLLVLLRATGGGCVDSDGDGVCDATDNCPAVFNPDQADANGNGFGDVCEPPPVKCDVDGDSDIDSIDVGMVRAGIGQVVGASDKRDANGDNKITIADVRACTLKCTRASCATN